MADVIRFEVKSVEEQKSNKTGNPYWLVHGTKEEKVCVFDAGFLAGVSEGSHVMVGLKAGSNIVEKLDVVDASDTDFSAKAPEAKESKPNRYGLASEHIVSIKGKEFVTFNGVLDLAHKNGLEALRIREQGIREDGEHFCIATAEFAGGKVFEAAGSCNKQNSSGNIASAWPTELAQTRAFGRALKMALNLDMTTREEMDQ